MSTTTENSFEGKYKYDKYIPKQYFKAVRFTLKMINKGMPFMFAVNKASYHYRTDETVIIDYLPEDLKREHRREILQ